MTERPLLRSAAQVRCLLAGATQVRVPVVPQPVGATELVYRDGLWQPCDDVLCRGALDRVGEPTRCPLGAPGDRLVVKERLALHHRYGLPLGPLPGQFDGLGTRAWSYAADEAHSGSITRRIAANHMPRWAARLILEVVEVRAQQGLLVIMRDVEAEGFPVEGAPKPTQLQVATAAYQHQCAWDGQYKRKGLPWSPGLWTFVARVKVVAS